MTIRPLFVQSDQKTFRLEGLRIDDFEACRVFIPPRKRLVSRDVGRHDPSFRDGINSAHQRSRFRVGYPQGPVGGFLMTRLGPVGITTPLVAVHMIMGGEYA